MDRSGQKDRTEQKNRSGQKNITEQKGRTEQNGRNRTEGQNRAAGRIGKKMEKWFDEEEFDIAAIEARHAKLETEEILNGLDEQKEAVETEGKTQADYPVEEWEAIIEAVLFTMGNSVELRQLAAAIDQDEAVARQVTEHLKKRYEQENRGMQIIALEDSYQMTTRAKYYENLIRVAAAPKKHVLTEVTLETLSIIAYKQPVTKVEISRIRGVSSDHAVNRLVEYGLVCEVGRLDAPGRPALFATTEEFLRRFGVTSTVDLPSINPEQEEEIVQEVQEELQMQIDLPPGESKAEQLELELLENLEEDRQSL